MHVLKKKIINEILKKLELVPLIERGFIFYSSKQCIIPPIGELLFEDPPGEVHIKYGYVMGESYYVIKIASGFSNNEKNGIPNGQGMMLLFNQKNGLPLAILLDEALLTNVRTAIAGQICAARFSNEIEMIGILGTGLQARMQVKHLKEITKCRKLIVWGRSNKKMNLYRVDMEKLGFKVELARSPKKLASKANLIVTTTSSKEHLLNKNDIMKGTHITAIGSDTPEKRELGPGVIKNADLVIADSISQCNKRGEIACAKKDGYLKTDNIIELGQVLSGNHPGRENKMQITVADLTGVAVQDVQIATAVYDNYIRRKYEI
tara:strand:+ start:176 stop:1135 length:960 start_codon:yes stop_codon:yes gene_type:complete